MTLEQEALSHLAVSYLTRLEVQGRIRSRWVPGMALSKWTDWDEQDRIRSVTPNEDNVGWWWVRTLHAGHPSRQMEQSPSGVWVDRKTGAHVSIPTPDLSNPLTVQALLLLFREASGDEGAHTYRVASGCWEVRWRETGSTKRRSVDGGVTEAHALVNGFKVLLDEGAS